MRSIIPTGCLKQSQAVRWKGSGVSRRMFHPLSIVWHSRCLGTRWGVVPMPRSRHHTPSFGTQSCGGLAGAARGWDRSAFLTSAASLEAVRGEPLLPAARSAHRCAPSPAVPHLILHRVPCLPFLVLAAQSCSGLASPQRPLGALQAGFHFAAVLCVSPAGGGRQTSWVTGRSRAVQSDFQAGWARGTLLMGSCKTEAFPAFSTQLRLVKKLSVFWLLPAKARLKISRLAPGL